MDERKAFVEAYNLIEEWKPTSDVFGLRYFPFATGGVSAVSAVYINAHYRKKLKLRNKVLISTLIPVVFLPALVSTLLHHHWVQRPLILQKFQCPVCLELRGGAVQLFAGFIYPLVLAPVAGFHFASKLFTYPLPPITEPKNLLNTFVKISRPALPKFFTLAAIQIVAGMALTHTEAHNLFTIMSKLSTMEMEVRDHQADKEHSADTSDWN